MKDIKYLPDNIYKYRDKMNLTHEELADMIGVSVRIIYDYESGKKTPSLITLFNLAKVLNTTLDSLVTKQDFLKKEM